jgi:hypothetical protein
VTRLTPLRFVLLVLNASSKGLFKRSLGENGDPPFPRISLVIGSDKFDLPGTQVKMYSPRRRPCLSLDMSVLERFSTGKRVVVAFCNVPLLSIRSSTGTLFPVSSNQSYCSYIEVSEASVQDKSSPVFDEEHTLLTFRDSQ